MLSFGIFRWLIGPVVWFIFFNALHCEHTTTESSLQPCQNMSLDCESLEPGQYP